MVLPALRVGTGKLTKRLESGPTLVFVLLEGLNDHTEEEREDGRELESDSRVIDARDESRDSLEASDSDKDLGILEGALENLHEHFLGARKFLTREVHLGQNLESKHGVLAAFDRLVVEETDKVLDKHVLLFEFGVDLGKNVTLEFQKLHGLILKIESTFDGGLELIELVVGKSSLGADIQEVLLEKDT